MSVDPARALACVARAVEAFNRSEGTSIPSSPHTVLLGAGGVVDSLGLVRLVLEIEREVQREFGTALSLTDERAMSQRNSPFRTVGSMAEYIRDHADEST